MSQTPQNEPTDTSASQGAGERLRETREARGISRAEVAAQLHLNEQTITALEQNDPSRLPAPIYVRGYVRAYARLLGLDEAELLEQYRPADSQPLRTVGISQGERKRLARPLIPWNLVGGILILAMLVGVGVFVVPPLWDRFQGDVQTEMSELPPQAPESETEVEPPAAVADGGVRLPDISSMPETPPEQPTIAPAPVPEATDIETPQAREEIVRVPAQERTPDPPAPEPREPPAQDMREVELLLNEDSWVSIRDAADRRLLVGLYKAGSRHEVSGEPPLQVVLGNAAGVELRVDGEPYPLDDYAPGSVARFTLD